MRNNRPSAALYELLEEIGGASGLEQALTVLDRRLRRVFPFEALAVFLLRDGRLALAYGSGKELRAVSGPETSVGQAIAGQVAQTRRPAFNLDPGREAGPNGPFRSMLAVPLEDGSALAGVLALYSADAGVFQPADLGVLLWIREDLARAIKHALGHDRPVPAATRQKLTASAPDRLAEELRFLGSALDEAGAKPVSDLDAETIK